MPQLLKDVIVDLDENAALEKVKEAVARGIAPLSIVEECRQGLQVVGERFDKGEYFLSELIVGAEIFRQAMQILEPMLLAGRGREKPLGKVVIGTVKGDIHDLGKKTPIGIPFCPSCASSRRKSASSPPTSKLTWRKPRRYSAATCV